MPPLVDIVHPVSYGKVLVITEDRAHPVWYVTVFFGPVKVVVFLTVMYVRVSEA